MKCALLSGLLVSSETGRMGWVGKKPLMRLRIPDWAGGGRLRIDLPGIGIVTAEDDGEQEEVAMISMSLTLMLVKLKSLIRLADFPRLQLASSTRLVKNLDDTIVYRTLPANTPCPERTVTLAFWCPSTPYNHIHGRQVWSRRSYPQHPCNRVDEIGKFNRHIIHIWMSSLQSPRSGASIISNRGR